MKRLIIALLALAGSSQLFAQELYVSTEPASNMPRHSIGIRLTNEGMFESDFKTRTIPEVMVGVNKNLMAHLSMYVSDFYQKKQKAEGWSVYAKYRFVTIDTANRHFRMAAFGRFSRSSNPMIMHKGTIMMIDPHGPDPLHEMPNMVVNQEINLEGDNSGMQGGLIATQLLHKLALSGSLSYIRALDNTNYALGAANTRESIGYTFSAGYLMYPKFYRDYKQTNVNLYVEFLGKSNPGRGQNYMDAAPALQFIFNSTLRLDLSKRFALWNNMDRMGRNMYLVRLEYNIFNAF
jgi:hypothetical protein